MSLTQLDTIFFANISKNSLVFCEVTIRQKSINTGELKTMMTVSFSLLPHFPNCDRSTYGSSDSKFHVFITEWNVFITKLVETRSCLMVDHGSDTQGEPGTAQRPQVPSPVDLCPAASRSTAFHALEDGRVSKSLLIIQFPFFLKDQHNCQSELLLTTRALWTDRTGVPLAKRVVETD